MEKLHVEQISCLSLDLQEKPAHSTCTDSWRYIVFRKFLAKMTQKNTANKNVRWRENKNQALSFSWREPKRLEGFHRRNKSQGFDRQEHMAQLNRPCFVVDIVVFHFFWKSLELSGTILIHWQLSVQVLWGISYKYFVLAVYWWRRSLFFSI